MPRVFLITGCSTGFGNEYAQEVINRGDIVVATARKPESLKFTGTNESNYLPCRLDVTDKPSIHATFAAALKKFGRVDVVVNNAGYGLAGCFEEYSDDQIRQQMEVNFFGLIDVTRIALETLRDRQTPQGGVIQQITSIGGQTGVPVFSLYCASKWAVEGFTEALSRELKDDWSIKLTNIEPGGFRTQWSSPQSMQFVPRHPAYDHIDAKSRMEKRHGTQTGDAKKAARAMYELAVMKEPPLRVVLGSDAYNAMMNKITEYDKNFKKYEELSKSCDIDGHDSSAS